LYIEFIFDTSCILPLVCDKCQEWFQGECPLHPLTRIADNIVNPSEFLKRAIASIPGGMEIRVSLIENAGLGVFSTTMFSNGATFGPYQGVKLRADIPRDGLDTSYMWEVSVSDSLEQIM
jgi:hypothetical protein